MSSIQKTFSVSCIYVLVLILMTASLNLHAQNKKIDSLKKVLPKVIGADKENTLNSLINELAAFNISEAKKYLRQLESIDNLSPNGKVNLKITKAQIRIKEMPGDSTAVILFQTALQDAIQLNYEKAVQIIVYDLTDLQSTIGDLTGCQLTLQRGYSYAAKTGSKELTAILYRQNGILEYYKGDLTKAIDFFKKSIDIYNSIGKSDEAGGLIMNIGVMEQRLGRTSESLIYYEKALKEFRKYRDSVNIANAIQNIAISESILGNEEKAIQRMLEIVPIYLSKKDYENLAGCYGNIGKSYMNLGNLKEAMNYFLKAAEITGKYNHPRGLTDSYINISELYEKTRDSVKAIEYLEKAKAITLKTGDEYTYAGILRLLSNYFYKGKDAVKGKQMLDESLRIVKKLDDMPGIASTLMAFGNFYKLNHNNQLALKHYKDALEIYKQTGEVENIAGLTNNIGVIHYENGKYRESVDYFLDALRIRKEIKDMNGIKESYVSLSNSYSLLNDYRNAYEYLYKHYLLSDSLFNTEISKTIAEMNTKYESAQKDKEIAERKAAADIANANAEKEKLERKSTENKLIFAVIALLLVAGLTGLVVYSNIQRKKNNQKLAEQNQEITEQKSEIEEQKKLVEEKQKEILDSITYAKRLQEAILPPLSTINANTKESFVLYKPKDIVAGDFYWAEKNRNLLYIAAADCTGHGVPGALVSVVCSNALNRSVKEFGISEPGKILDKTRELVLETFEKSGSDVKDGMDISLLCINTETHEVCWSGANNSLCYISNNNLFEIKADKQPVGKTERSMPFTTHNISAEKDTVFYLFTDGFADQFGGIKGKKFKNKQLQEAFLKHHQIPLNEQKEIFMNAFESWKGDLEQIDDVCIIGIKI